VVPARCYRDILSIRRSFGEGGFSMVVFFGGSSFGRQGSSFFTTDFFEASF
jgi:hypothetical protein